MKRISRISQVVSTPLRAERLNDQAVETCFKLDNSKVFNVASSQPTVRAADLGPTAHPQGKCGFLVSPPSHAPQRKAKLSCFKYGNIDSNLHIKTMIMSFLLNNQLQKANKEERWYMIQQNICLVHLPNNPLITFTHNLNQSLIL
jgi:hypothetical protein